MACMTRFALAGSLSPSSLPKIAGTICHDRPYLSWSQPHLVFSAACRQLVPQLVYFLLRVTVHEQRDRRRELELRAAVQGVEVLSLELECRPHDRPLLARPCLPIPRDAHDL